MLRIAIRMLLNDPTKWVGLVLGVFFCTFLVTHLLGMVHGMLARTYAVITDIRQAHVWVMDPAVEYVEEPAGLPPTALERVRSVAGVQWATPLYTGSLRARLPSGVFRSVLLVGVDDATFVGLPHDIIGGRPEDLRRADAVMLDTISADTLMALPLALASPAWGEPHGPRHADKAHARAMRVGDEFQLNDRRAVVVGLVKLGPRFLSRPVVYTTYSRATQMTPKQRTMLSFVLAEPARGTDAATLARRIEADTGLRARTAAEFSNDTYWYYVRTTGVVARIIFMAGIGVVVGVCVSALLLYLFTAENARHYAVLKALGATNATIVGMVIVQAIAAGVCGYGLGVGGSAAFAALVPTDDIPYAARASTLAVSAAAVVVVCVVASTLSARRVFTLEPGLVFRG